MKQYKIIIKIDFQNRFVLFIMHFLYITLTPLDLYLSKFDYKKVNIYNYLTDNYRFFM